MLGEIERSLKQNSVEYDIYFSEYAKHLPKIILDFPPADFNYDCIGVCGGDGTLQEVADAVIRKFQILPASDKRDRSGEVDNENEKATGKNSADCSPNGPVDEELDENSSDRGNSAVSVASSSVNNRSDHENTSELKQAERAREVKSDNTGAFEPISRDKLCPIAVLPGGTGNSTALTLGIEDVDSAMKNLLAGEKRFLLLRGNEQDFERTVVENHWN